MLTIRRRLRPILAGGSGRTAHLVRNLGSLLLRSDLSLHPTRQLVQEGIVFVLQVVLQGAMLVLHGIMLDLQGVMLDLQGIQLSLELVRRDAIFAAVQHDRRLHRSGGVNEAEEEAHKESGCAFAGLSGGWHRFPADKATQGPLSIDLSAKPWNSAGHMTRNPLCLEQPLAHLLTLREAVSACLCHRIFNQKRQQHRHGHREVCDDLKHPPIVLSSPILRAIVITEREHTCHMAQAHDRTEMSEQLGMSTSRL